MREKSKNPRKKGRKIEARGQKIFKKDKKVVENATKKGGKSQRIEKRARNLRNKLQNNYNNKLPLPGRSRWLLVTVLEMFWTIKVRLAAALARNRIKHRALRLNHLLPNHLRDERLLSVDEAPATGWVNTFLTTKTEIISHLSELGISLTTPADKHGKFDHVCPKVISFPAECRAHLARSDHIKSGKLILQDRAFCLAPAFLHKIVEELSLRGTVAQSHVISPRATAYLATVLLDNEKIEKVLAFGTGSR